METVALFEKLNKVYIKVDASLLEFNVFIKIPDYAWPKYFGGYRELLLKNNNKGTIFKVSIVLQYLKEQM